MLRFRRPSDEDDDDPDAPPKMRAQVIGLIILVACLPIYALVVSSNNQRTQMEYLGESTAIGVYTAEQQERKYNTRWWTEEAWMSYEVHRQEGGKLLNFNVLKCDASFDSSEVTCQVLAERERGDYLESATFDRRRMTKFKSKIAPPLESLEY